MIYAPHGSADSAVEEPVAERKKLTWGATPSQLSHNSRNLPDYVRERNSLL